MVLFQPVTPSRCPYFETQPPFFMCKVKSSPCLYANDPIKSKEIKNCYKNCADYRSKIALQQTLKD